MATDATRVTAPSIDQATTAAGVDARRPAVAPLTERILERLARRGARRAWWIALWAAIPLLSPIVFSTAVRASGGSFDLRDFMEFLATQGGLAWACGVLLWGVGLLGRSATDTRDELIRSAPDHVPGSLFGAAGDRSGPIALTLVVAAAASVNGWLTYGPVAPLAALPLLVAYLLPILTFVWVYVAVLVDIDRLGRLPIVLDRFPQDRTMGLERIGGLASSGLGVLLLAAVPVLLAGSDEPVTFALSLAVVGGAVGAFGLSMWRLHRRMVEAKATYVATARRLYAEAYAPIRATPDLATLTEQSSALGAARSLDERAASLATWPLDEGTAKFIAVVVTGVLTSLIVRALFAAIGF